MNYKEIIASIIAQAALASLENKKTPGRSLLDPPRRKQYNLVEKVGNLHLPYDSRKVLNLIANSFNCKPIDIAEILLQAILNSIPIIEALEDNTIETKQLVKMIEDSIIIDRQLHANL